MNIKKWAPSGETIMNCEVIELQNQCKIKSNIRKFKLDEINQAIDLLKQGQIDGREVIIP